MLGGGVGWGEGVDKMIEYARFARERKSLGLWFWWILQKRPQSNVYFTPKFLPPACYRWIVLKMHQSSVYVSPSPFPPPISLINPLLKMNPLKWPQSIIIPLPPTPLPIKPLQSCVITDFTQKTGIFLIIPLKKGRSGTRKAIFSLNSCLLYRAFARLYPILTPHIDD